MKNDTRFIFKAAAHAQRAADYLASFSRDGGTTSASDVTDEAEARAA